MDKHTRSLTALRSKLYCTHATYTATGDIADLQWRVGNNGRFEIYYTNAAGWSGVHVMDYQGVMNATHTEWLTGELSADGIHLHAEDAQRIVQQYAIATTANWHPHLPKLQRNQQSAA